jgi:enamine deaminase RidA (YjgF/YER057c/UK114 family)
MSQKAEMNEVWTAWLGTLARPARACVGTPLATPDTLIEIVVNAAV